MGPPDREPPRFQTGPTRAPLRPRPPPTERRSAPDRATGRSTDPPTAPPHRRWPASNRTGTRPEAERWPSACRRQPPPRREAGCSRKRRPRSDPAAARAGRRPRPAVLRGAAGARSGAPPVRRGPVQIGQARRPSAPGWGTAERRSSIVLPCPASKSRRALRPRAVRRRLPPLRGTERRKAPNGAPHRLAGPPQPRRLVPAHRSQAPDRLRARFPASFFGSSEWTQRAEQRVSTDRSAESGSAGD